MIDIHRAVHSKGKQLMTGNKYTTLRNAGLEEAQAGIKTAGRNINNLRYIDASAAAAKSLQSCLTP